MMTADFYARIIGMFVFGGVGVVWGTFLGRVGTGDEYLSAVVIGLLGVLAGLVLTPYLTTRPLKLIRNRLNHAPTRTFLAGLIGLVLGLFVSALLAYPLSLLPPPLGAYLPVTGAVVFGYLGMMVFAARHDDLLAVVRPADQTRRAQARSLREERADLPDAGEPMVILDTSVIIDGRIEDIAKTGFLPGTLLIPHFVLNELQYIADSPDSLRRQRGRRGMEVLANLQKTPTVDITISDIDFDEASQVDDKLVILAKQTGSAILTNDYNLNRVADLQGVKILNINELANAVKAVYLPGESLLVEIIQEGKELGQGVGYLDDGTMIVVENGSDYLGEEIQTLVTKVLQTAAGRMIFARPDEG